MILRHSFAVIAKSSACLLLASHTGMSHAQAARPYSLVCFERAGLTRSLAAVVNALQFLRNDSILRNRSCDFAQVPAGSTARFSGFHESKNGFIFPLFRIAYATTGQTMYSADGIFRAEHWRVSRHCGDRLTGTYCLRPNRCDALDGFLVAPGRSMPNYIFVPEICRTFVVE